MKLGKMNFIFLVVTIIISTLFILNYLIYKQKRDSYNKAGKKWDEIVKELSKRK